MHLHFASRMLEGCTRYPGNSEVEGVLLPGNRVDGLAEKWWELMSWSVQALEKNFQT